MYVDQFEEFRAQAKRGSIDGFFLEGVPGRLAQGGDYHENVSSAPSSRERTPVRLSAARSAHARSHSFKVRPKRAPQDLLVMENMRPRTASMPNCSCNKAELLEPPDEKEGGGLYRVRSFKTSSKGITNRWDFYKSRSSNTVDSSESNGTGNSNPDIERRSRSSTPAKTRSDVVPTNGGSHGAVKPATPHHLAPPLQKIAIISQGNYHTILLGSVNVGKTALVKQFMTSEFLGGYARSISIDEETQEKSVSVLLDGVESNMTFLDLSSDEDYKNYDEPDCYCVIYSVDVRESFDHAVDLLFTIRKHQLREVAMILVGNKAELERTRVVTPEEGREAAVQYDCKFIETSVALNHRVDDLLVGILSQIRLTPKRQELKRRKSKLKSKEGITKATKGLLDRIFRRGSVTKSAENLLSV